MSDNKKNKLMLPDEVIMRKIYLIRGKKVMLDRELSELYGVETKVLKQAVRRNWSRFPEDFMFEMTKEELQIWRSQFVTSKSDMKGLRYAPFCFTEHGILMLASVLSSERAVQINIQIVRIFNRMREMLISSKELFIEIEKIREHLSEHDDKIMLIFEYLKQFEETKQQELEQQNRKQIGFNRTDKKIIPTKQNPVSSYPVK